MYIEAVPQPQLAARRAPARVLPRRPQSQETHAGQPVEMPPEVVEGLRVLLKGGTAVKRLPEAFEIERSLPHGHAAAALGAIERLGLPA